MMKIKSLSFLLVTLVLVACNDSSAQKRLDAVHFNDQLANATSPQIVDVRTPGEFSDGHLKEAMNINVNDENFSNELKKLDSDKPLFLYCGSGVRSAKAANIAAKMGFKEIYDMEGGINSWMNNELPVEK